MAPGRSWPRLRGLAAATGGVIVAGFAERTAAGAVQLGRGGERGRRGAGLPQDAPVCWTRRRSSCPATPVFASSSMRRAHRHDGLLRLVSSRNRRARWRCAARRSSPTRPTWCCPTARPRWSPAAWRTACSSITTNRYGTETLADGRSLTFTGASQVLTLRGATAGAGADRWGRRALAEIDPALADDKHVTARNDLFADRRPRDVRIGVPSRHKRFLQSRP